MHSALVLHVFFCQAFKSLPIYLSAYISIWLPYGQSIVSIHSVIPGLDRTGFSFRFISWIKLDQDQWLVDLGWTGSFHLNPFQTLAVWLLVWSATLPLPPPSKSRGALAPAGSPDQSVTGGWLGLPTLLLAASAESPVSVIWAQQFTRWVLIASLRGGDSRPMRDGRWSAAGVVHSVPPTRIAESW